MDLNSVITPNLRNLRENGFVARGFDLQFVGGFVRDIVRGIEFKDIDFRTDANPDEQIAIYKALGIAYYETGLAHGTVSVLLDGETYEITSLRTESDHDGRHATVDYTRDWMADLGRRDLTFNAMALTFDGELIDPFNGKDDLEKGIVRFVGNPDDRMREDYLRILRWLRFQGRIAPTSPLDKETVEAAKRQAHGLLGISRERVWMEVQKIIAGKAGEDLIQTIYDLGIAPHIDLPQGCVRRLCAARLFTRNPVTLMVALLNGDTVGSFPPMAERWKWSAEERDLADFLAGYMLKPDYESWQCTDNYARLLAHDRKPEEWVYELARLRGNVQAVEFMDSWIVPVFPVKGQDLLAVGMKPGPAVGQRLVRMKDAWTESRYTLSKEQLIADVS